MPIELPLTIELKLSENNIYHNKGASPPDASTTTSPMNFIFYTVLVALYFINYSKINIHHDMRPKTETSNNGWVFIGCLTGFFYRQNFQGTKLLKYTAGLSTSWPLATDRDLSDVLFELFI